MINFGNFLFKHRNWFFPIFYLLLFVPSPELSANPMGIFWVGVAIAAFGQVIRDITIGFVYIVRGGDANKEIHANELYTKGLMAHSRNPLYIGNILILLGMGIASNSVLFLLVAFPIFVVFYQAIVLAEEAYLASQFGAAYEKYKSEVNRWLPDLTNLGKTFREMKFSWNRVMKAEYNPTFLWMIASFFIAVKHYATHPNLYNFEESLPVFGFILVVLLTVYLSVRYFKKAGKFEGA